MFADIGIPLIGPVIVLGWFTIVPVVIIETLVAVWMLRWRVGFALRSVALANALSMLLGFPLMWFLCVLASLLTGGGGWGDGSMLDIVKGPAWLGPGYIEDLGWAVPFALILLCVPFFFMSWWIEYLCLFNFSVKRDEEQRISIRAYAWKANLASYALLVVFLIAAMVCRW
jgi:hypothetical protein